MPRLAPVLPEPLSGAAAPRRPGNAILAGSIALLVAFTAWVYSPVSGHAFVAYDDGEYVTNNAKVQAGLTRSGVKWAFTTGHASNWHPLTWLSHMLDVQLFGHGPLGPHVVSVGFHFVNALLVWAVFHQLTGSRWRSLVVAALFAVHPAHVESVAWVAERKDVLSGFFFLLTVWAYGRYAAAKEGGRSHEVEQGAIGWYVTTLLFFACGLMSKPMIVTLPCVLLLLDVWPLRRFNAPRRAGATIAEKLPFFFLSAVSSVVTFAVQQRGGTVRSLETLSFVQRTENAVVSYGRYLGKLFWPTDLAFFYPHSGHWPAWQIASSLAILLVITAGAFALRRRVPALPVGWLWFGGMLVPVIGLVQVGDQSIADRYTYLPSLGLFFAVTWGAAALAAARPRLHLPFTALAVVAVAGCGIVARAQVQTWRNTPTLCAHALAVTGENFVAYNSLASEAFAEGRLDDAVRSYAHALQIRPDFAVGHHNLAMALWRQNRLGDAVTHLRQVVALEPANAVGWNNLGWMLRIDERYPEAIAALQRALELRPDFGEAHNNLGKALAAQGEVRAALSHYESALASQPENSRALLNLAWLRATASDAALRNGPDAVVLAERALALSDRDDVDVLEALAAAYAEAQRFSDAIATAERACRSAAMPTETKPDAVKRLEAELARYRNHAAWRDVNVPGGRP